jgi:hydroxyethylthiazole kinase-like uncharacterized protein yjeF
MSHTPERLSIVSAAAMRERDRLTMEGFGLPGMVLMERAALACSDVILSRTPASAPVCVLAGPGNNGGDGLAIARQLHGAGRDVAVVLAADPARLSGDTAAQFRMLLALDIPVVVVEPGEDDFTSVLQAPVWVDALLGTGSTGAPRGIIAQVLESATALRELAWVLAVDLPSGAEADSGRVSGSALRADVTVTFDSRKWAHVLPPALDHIGELVVADIGIPAHVAQEAPADAEIAYVGRTVAPLPAFLPSSHKSSRGRAVVWAGSEVMPGAAVLSSIAALRSGAGLVHLIAPSTVLSLALHQQPALLVYEPERADEAIRFADSVVVGPGLGVDRAAEVLRLLKPALQGGLRAVLDADALTALAALRTPAGVEVVLTPHPGELARLLACDTSEVLSDLPRAARAAAELYACVVVAKTAGAIVTDGEDVVMVPAGDPGMATAGSGDVLAGIIGALLASYPDADLMHLAAAGAMVHARSGAAARAQLGASETLTASDLVAHLGSAFLSVRGG